MRVAVIGTGLVGQTLGRAFAKAGIDTVFGSRRPDGDVIAVEPAIARSDIVLLAMPGSAVEDFLRTNGDSLAGKLIVDAANNISAPVSHSADAVAAHAPQARYARAFNTLGVENFADPTFGGTAADLFFSCDEADRAAVETLIHGVGLRPMYVGEKQYDILDAVVRLWFALAVGQGHGRHLAFRTLTDAEPSSGTDQSTWDTRPATLGTDRMSRSRNSG